MNAIIIINDEFRSTKPVSYINVSILRKGASHLNIDRIKKHIRLINTPPPRSYTLFFSSFSFTFPRKSDIGGGEGGGGEGEKVQPSL